MTGLLLTLDPALVALSLVIWGWASIRAAGLPLGATAGLIRRRSTITATLIIVGVLLVAARVGLVMVLGQAGWSSVGETVVLVLPLLLVPALLALVVSVPRLARLRRTARVFPAAVPPSLRHEAAHPMVAWPVQATAIGAATGAVVLFFVGDPATAGSSFALASAAGFGALTCWLRLRRRHERYGGLVFFPRQKSAVAARPLWMDGPMSERKGTLLTPDAAQGALLNT